MPHARREAALGFVPGPEMSGTGLRFRARPLVYNGSIRVVTILGNNGKEPTYVIRNCAY